MKPSGAPRRVVRAIAGATLVAITLALAALGLAQRLVTDSQPLVELTRYLPFYWLALPAVLAAALAIALGGRWQLASALPVLALALVTLQPSWGGLGAKPASTGFRFMTYNVKAPTAITNGTGFAAIAAEVRAADPDVLVLQDADGLVAARTAPPARSAAPLFGLPHVHALGQYVLASRFPIDDCAAGQIGYQAETHRYLRCRVEVDGRALTVVTAHFKSPRGGLSAARRQGVGGVSEWEQNLADRLAQARALAADLATIRGPVVVAGDLNAPDTSPVVRALLHTGLRDAHAVAGLGYGYTFGQETRIGLSFLRIDHVLVGPGLSVGRATVGGGKASTHRPVIADLGFDDTLASPLVDIR